MGGLSIRLERLIFARLGPAHLEGEIGGRTIRQSVKILAIMHLLPARRPLYPPSLHFSFSALACDGERRALPKFAREPIRPSYMSANDSSCPPKPTPQRRVDRIMTFHTHNKREIPPRPRSIVILSRPPLAQSKGEFEFSASPSRVLPGA